MKISKFSLEMPFLTTVFIDMLPLPEFHYITHSLLPEIHYNSLNYSSCPYITALQKDYCFFNFSHSVVFPWRILSTTRKILRYARTVAAIV